MIAPPTARYKQLPRIARIAPSRRPGLPRVVIGDFKDEHNDQHRHSALGYRTPAELAAVCSHDHYAMACEID